MTDPVLRRLWPLGPWPLLLPAAAIAAAAVLATTAMRSWPYQEWVRTSAEFHQQNAFAGPIAAAAATYYAGRLTRPDRVFALPSAPRAGRDSARRHLGLLAVTFTLAYLVGMAPLTAVTVEHAEHGGPDPLPIATGLLGLWASIAVGYLIGVVGRGALWAPISFVAVFAVVVLGTGGDTFSALVPVLHVAPAAGRVEALPFTVYRVAFFLLVAVAAVVAATAVLRRHRTRHRPVRAMAPLLVPVVLAVPAVVSTPALFAVEQDVQRVCRTQRGIEHCVHAAHRSRLPVMEQATAAVLTAYGDDTSGRVRRVYDESLRWATAVDDAASGNTEAHQDVVWVAVQPMSPTDHTGREVAWLLAGATACAARSDTTDEERALTVELALWLQNGGRAASSGPLSGIAPHALRDWMSAHRTGLDTCVLTAADLPG
ncbi:hypothetical protein [Saccharothrix coeruleofusca]|uniref:Uncharacterized protein n=1 Tax=Saccharothrix coeruleofusca TaxID=33919 RepID=A0A918AIU1_9PSEU|nr:hypothetical protein [Saccharothrix coeruleofusca]GGP34680.1 hypothetical protein GCM10010185_01690 [Saccharothrix coeruleofusca]